MNRGLRVGLKVGKKKPKGKGTGTVALQSAGRAVFGKSGRRVVALLAASGLAFGACGGSAAPGSKGGAATTSNGAATSKGTAPQQIRIGVQGNWPPIDTVEVAAKMGFLKREGLVPKFVTLQNAPSGVDGLLGGSLDVIVTAADWCQAVIKGQKNLVAVASTLNVAPFKVITIPNIHTWGQLKGATVGIVSPYGVSTVALSLALKEAGLGMGDIHTVVAGNTSGRFNAVLNHKVDAADVATPFDLKAKEEGLTDLGVAPTGGSPPPIVTASVTVRKSWAQTAKGKAVLEELLKGLLAFTHYAYGSGHLEKVAAATAEVMNLSTKYTQPAWTEIVKEKWLPANLEVSKANMAAYLKGYESLGASLPSSISSHLSQFVDSIVDDSYLQAAAGSGK